MSVKCRHCNYFGRGETSIEERFLTGRLYRNPISISPISNIKEVDFRVMSAEDKSNYIEIPSIRATNTWGVNVCHHDSCFSDQEIDAITGLSKGSKIRVQGQAQLNINNTCRYFSITFIGWLKEMFTK